MVRHYKRYKADWDEEPRHNYEVDYPSPPSSDEYRKDDWMNRVDYLISILNKVKNTQMYSFQSYPAELVFSMLKEIHLFVLYFFSIEHRDILARNPSLRIIYRKSIFHGFDGNRYIDTGLPESQRIVTKRPQLRKELILKEYFGDFLQDLIELEKAYFNNKLSAFFSERRNFGSNRPEKTLVQPQKPIREKTLDRQVFYLRRQIRLLKKQLAQQRPSKTRRINNHN